MGATSEYGLIWPELSDAADGPSAFQLLAEEMDAKLPTLRWADSGYGQNGFTALPGQIADAHSESTHPLVAIGWVDVTFEITLVSPLYGTAQQSSANFAGAYFVYVNGTQAGSPHRFHSTGLVRSTNTIHRTAPLFKSTNTLSIQCKFSLDTPSSSGGAYVAIDNWALAQYGVLRT